MDNKQTFFAENWKNVTILYFGCMGILCFALFWIHGNFMFWMTRVSVCNPSYWNTIAGFVIHTTGTLKLEDGLKTTN